MLAIFGFRKNRSNTQAGQGPPECDAEIYGDGCHTVATAPTGCVHIITETTAPLNTQHMKENNNTHIRKDLFPDTHGLGFIFPLFLILSSS